MSSNSMISSNEKAWAIASHLLTFLGYSLFIGHFIGPLVILLLKKDESPFIAHHAKESLNFAISWLIYMAVAVTISALLMIVLIGFLLIWILPALLGLWQLVAIIIGAVKASQGEYYYYPCTIRFLK